MSTVKFTGPNNSTLFTTCCGVAICDDQKDCPICGVEILPHSHRSRWEVAMNALYGAKRLKEIRQSYVR